MNFIEPEPHKKKVQFADILGQDLVKVRYITPNNSHENMINLLCNELQLTENILDSSDFKQFVCDFRKLLNKESFPQRVVTQNVCLEDILVSGFVNKGIVRVKNIAHTKQVFVRYTLDNWQSYQDCWADFVPYSSDGITDKFSFRIQVSKELVSLQRIEFAICYRVGNGEYWDNNFNQNYSLNVRRKAKVCRRRQNLRWEKQYQEWEQL